MEDTKIYRFITLFELYKLVFDKKLKYSRLSTFEDKNEGIFQVLHHMESLYTRHRYNTNDDLKKSHYDLLINTYASCWALEPDLIALWSIYSKNIDGVRITSTTKKLTEASEVFYKENFSLKFIDEPGSRRFCTYSINSGCVSYHDPLELRDLLKNKYIEFKKLMNKKSRINSKYFETEEFKKDFSEMENYIIINDGLLMKDKSYIHEREYRSILKCAVRSSLTKEEIISHNGFGLLGIDSGTDTEMPKYIFIDVQPGFVEKICIDPRAPIYQQDIIRKIFEPCGIEFETSKAFGYCIEDRDFVVPFAKTMSLFSDEID